MAGKNKKTSLIKDIDELEKEKQIEEKVEEPKDDIQEEPTVDEKVEEPKDEIKSVNLKKVQVDPWLNIRNKPSMSGSEIIGRVENDDIVEIFAIKDDFAKISETEEKWVNMNYLVPVKS